jgi:hypothetical protein
LHINSLFLGCNVPNHDPFSLKTVQNSMLLDKPPGSGCFLRVKVGN